MGILDRFKDIMSSNINALLDRAEDPEKMIDQYLRNSKRDLADVRKETAGVMAEEKRAKDKLNELHLEIDRMTELAKKALQSGNREDAGVFIAKKQKLEVELPEYLGVYQAAQTNANQMREMYNKLVSDIETMEYRKNIIKGKAAATRARETVNRMGSTSSKHGAVMGKMGAMEDKVNQRFNAAMAESELLNEPQDEAAALEEKYKGGTSITVNAELDELAAELGLSTPTIQDTED